MLLLAVTDHAGGGGLDVETNSAKKRNPPMGSNVVVNTVMVVHIIATHQALGSEKDLDRLAKGLQGPLLPANCFWLLDLCETKHDLLCSHSLQGDSHGPMVIHEHPG